MNAPTSKGRKTKKASKVKKAMAAGKNKQAGRLSRLEKGLSQVSRAQALHGARLQTLIAAYGNLLSKLVEKGVLTEEELGGPKKQEEVVRESIEDDGPPKEKG